ncbi:MAG TPA: 16S rRNA (adenine(1518)-N(6)/adenine(1519)-N(6))-dimethyltransferase RsmA [Polyangiaceae bacterium]|nr:16S rRNA (adenine(1518)-N(6)/adenine(1519)-N(6))-dimethyltransferase RsmA [Polyangiaceae bacterium]
MSSLASRGVRPKKSLGQNFLTDPAICARIADAANASAGTVLEIGPGAGAITRPLLERAAHVVAIERDRDLVALLENELAAEIEGDRFRIVSGDATEVDWLPLFEGRPRPHVVAGNLPYLLTGRFLELATTHADAIDRVVFMVQLEVAERLLAAPGTAAYGALTVFVRAAFDVSRVVVVKAGAFFPRPDVDSCVVALSPLRPRRAEEDAAFRGAVRGAFGMRRKTLRNAWRGLLGLDDATVAGAAAEAGIDLGLRGETLDVDAFARFAAALRARSAAASSG